MTTSHTQLKRRGQKAKRKNWRQWDRRTSQLAHAAKRAKIIRVAVAADEVGVVVFAGPMFGGMTHRLRLLNQAGERHLLLEFDGVPAKPRTYRGVLRLLARRLTQPPSASSIARAPAASTPLP